MTATRIPDNAIGRPGMVAMLQRTTDGVHDGKLVALRKPVGIVSALFGGTSPSFAWEALVLASPVSINGKSKREIIVADFCLRPVSQITPDQVELLVKRLARQDFDAAMNDLAKILSAGKMDEHEFDRFVLKAEQQFCIGRTLEVVSVAQCLDEMGFRQQNPPSGEVLTWSGVHGETELEISAGSDWSGRWQLAARCNTGIRAMWHETVLPPEAPRGAVAVAMVAFWRTAFGRVAPLPDVFDLGLRYENHQATLRTLDLGLPYVDLNGEILRATRRWMMQRYGLTDHFLGPMPDAPLYLSIENGLLRMGAEGAVYGCPVQCGWIDPCQVSLREFLAWPAWALKGHTVRLNTTVQEANVGRWSVSVLPAKAVA
jgi:hypothetical protein